MKRFGERFGRIGYSCIFDPDMKAAWSNEKPLFRKIASSRVFVDAFKAAADAHESFANLLTYNGIKFKAEFLPLPDRTYLCVAYPEDRYVRFAYSEMYMRIFNIRKNADKALADAHRLKEMLTGCGAADEAMKLAEEQIAFCESAAYEASGIARLFDADNICRYVNISEKINETYRRIQKYDPLLGRSVVFDTDIKRSVAKVNYDVLESALIEIARTLYKYLPKGGKACVRIRERGNSGIRIETSSDVNENADIGSLDHEIRDIRCAFSFLGGSADVLHGKDGLVIRAATPAVLSEHKRRVKTYDLTDTDDGDDIYEALSGYTGLSAEELKKEEKSLVFRSTRTEPEYPLSDILIDIMLNSLIPA